jgi:hypothetical protein
MLPLRLGTFRKEETMKKSVILASLGLAIVLGNPSSAFAWGSAVHAIIGHELSVKAGQKDDDQIYGAMAPDVFNYQLDAAFLDLANETHVDFLKVRKAARGKDEAALAYGFVSHNDVWGADFTAHHSGVTYGQGVGYVILKAETLRDLALEGKLGELPPLELLGIDPDIAFGLYHAFVESAGDVLAKRIDPAIGARIEKAAAGRSDSFPALLDKAYGARLAADLGGDPTAARAAARASIAGTEAWFQAFMIDYGRALQGSEADAVEAFSYQLATLAEMYLGGLPQGVDFDMARQLIAGYLQAAMAICEEDLAAEVEATIRFVDSH